MVCRRSRTCARFGGAQEPPCCASRPTRTSEIYPHFLLADVIQEVTGDISTYKPSQEVSARWERTTRASYDPFDSFWKLQEQEVLCPKCNVQLFIREFALSYSPVHWRTPLPLAYLTEGQSGYAERAFAHACKHCSFLIDRDKLAVAKFARDFVMDPTNTRDAEKYGNAIYLPYVDPFTLYRVTKCP